jgi:ubiquinone/menaquinone biosynthesis C-methylase UbiE
VALDFTSWQSRRRNDYERKNHLKSISAITNANVAGYEKPSAVTSYSSDRGLYAIEKELISLHFPAPPGRILDIGCGAGRTTGELVQMGYAVAAIDLATELLLVARDRSKAFISKMNGTELGFRDASFDACLFSFNGIDCIYPFADRQKLFVEVKRILRPGGKFYFSSHNIFGHFGRNALNGIRPGWRANLRFLKQQARNQIIREGYWAFEDVDGMQLLYATSPRAQMRELVKMGFTIHSVRGLKWYREDYSVALNNCGESSLINEATRENFSNQVSMWKLKWLYPHIQYVASV